MREINSHFNPNVVADCGNYLSEICNRLATQAGWWETRDLADKQTVPTCLMLIVSELSEAMEGHRKGVMDDKLPDRPMLDVELADAAIRIFDLAGALGINLGEVIADKLLFNMDRLDHKPEAREAEGGKAY